MAGTGDGGTTTLRAAVQDLLGSFSIEVTPPELAKDPDVVDVLDPGTRVYLTFLPKVPFADVVGCARRVRERGLRPVVHLAVREVADLHELDRMLGRLVDVGVADLLLIAGSSARPAGGIDDTVQVLESGPLRWREFASIGIAGHPEGNPGVDQQKVEAALAAKNALAATHGLPMHLVTQFCFAGDPVVAWERRIRAAGNTLPVHVGLPGLTSPTRLLRFGVACGVGASLSVLRKQLGGVLTLATRPVYHPDETLLGIASARLADPDSLLRSVHFFPFGAIDATVRWARSLRDGRFGFTDTGRLSVPA